MSDVIASAVDTENLDWIDGDPTQVQNRVLDGTVDPTSSGHHKQFDFIHIRYRRTPSGSSNDGSHIFRAAFQQTKPGGWIEVVDSGEGAHASLQEVHSKSCHRSPALSALHNVVAAGNKSFVTSKLIKDQLLDAGFVEVQEKVSTNSSGALHKIGKFLSFLVSMNWVRDVNTDICSLNSRSSYASFNNRPTSVFVIARKP
ncbi:hypothetical protein EDC01DRAFT_625810 [Geopyxis carbonaria]|nr:hypothetical protein EDC01DRAFT_625810 [Geopyxis carbonaria]